MYQFGDNVVPGWRVHRGDDGIVRIVLNGSAILNVTSVDGSPVANDVLFAMAAAPELLEIAAELCNLVAAPDGYGGDLADLASRAMAAIDKAEGRGE